MSKKVKDQLVIEDENSEDEVDIDSVSDKDEVDDDLDSEVSSNSDEDEIEEEQEELADDKDDDVEEDEDEELECYMKESIEDDIVIPDNENDILPNEKRISSSRMSRYEFNRLIGTRTQQLVGNAKPMLKNIEGLDYDEIVMLEIKNNTCPLKIKRPLPNGKYEIWKLSELKKDHLF